MTFESTVGEFASKINQEYAVAAALIKFLQSIGKAKEIGKRPAKGGKGKPSSIFQIEEKLDVNWNLPKVTPIIPLSDDAPFDQTNEFEAMHS